jgi:hypothetical protein
MTPLLLVSAIFAAVLCTDVCDITYYGYGCTGVLKSFKPYANCSVCHITGSASYKFFCDLGYYKWYSASTVCTGSSSTTYYPRCHNGTNLSVWYNWCNITVSLPVPAPAAPVPAPAPAPVAAPAAPAPPPDVCSFLFNGTGCGGPILSTTPFCACNTCTLSPSGTQSYQCFCSLGFYTWYQSSTDCTGSSANYIYPDCQDGTNLSTWYNWCNGSYLALPAPAPAPIPAPAPAPGPPPDICEFVFNGTSCTGPINNIQPFCTCGVCNVPLTGSYSYQCFCPQNYYRWYQSANDCTGSYADYYYPDCHNGTGLSVWYNWCNDTSPAPSPPTPTPTPTPTPVPPPPGPKPKPKPKPSPNRRR